MSEEIEFLEYIYQNAKIGQESIARLLKTRNQNDPIEAIIKEQYEDYKKISNSAKGMIERRKRKVKEIGVIAKIGTYMSVKMNLEKDDSASEIALMLTEVSKMGVQEIERYQNEYRVKNKSILNLAQRMLEMELKNIQNLKLYLK